MLSSIFFAALVTALATGLGALPFIRTSTVSDRFLAYGNAIAAGLMMTASFFMLEEGKIYGLTGVVLGVLIGVGFIIVSKHRLHRYEHLKFEGTSGLSATKMLLLIGVMTAHSFTEGIAIGAAFGPGETLGLLVVIAMAIQNIPEGLAISVVMVSRGVSRWRAGLWSIVTSLPQPLMAVPAYLFVSVFQPFLPLSLGFAAGAMIWMSVSELLPDAFAHAKPEHVATILTISIALMVLVQGWL